MRDLMLRRDPLIGRGRSPFRDLMDFRSGLDRWFENVFELLDEGEGFGWKPAVDMEEKDNEYVAKMELPGINKEDIKITVNNNNNNIEVSGEVKEEDDVQNKNYYVKERVRGRFSRGISLPSVVDTENVEAKFKDGILELRIPKTEEAKPKEIDIKEG